MSVDLVVAPVDLHAARYAVEHWHYSGCLPAGKMVRLGAWENDRFVGVVLFSRGASPYLARRYDLGTYEVCELTRVALRDHVSPVSQIVARAVRMLAATSPMLRLVVSFADPAQGHHGGIYQAGNWLYLGESAATTMYLVGGRRVHRRTYRDRKRRHLADPDVETATAPPKHRYVLPLDRAMRRKLAPLALPYPPAS